MLLMCYYNMLRKKCIPCSIEQSQEFKLKDTLLLSTPPALFPLNFSVNYDNLLMFIVGSRVTKI